MRELVEKQLAEHKTQKIESDNAVYESDNVRAEIDLIEKRTYLKKRYVQQYQMLKNRTAQRRKDEEMQRKRVADHKRNQQAVYDKVNQEFKAQ